MAPEGVMAENFRLSFKLQKGRFQVDLAGDFDGTSAFELLHFLRENCSKYKKVCINTNYLGEIHRFGRYVILNHLLFMQSHNHIICCGENALVFAGS